MGQFLVLIIKTNMFNLPSRIIIFDTEYTTWEGAMERKWSGPGEHREIVEIGAILVGTQNFSELGSFSIYVKPTKNPRLSTYFTKLTGITQETVDAQGVGFAEALQKFLEWSGPLELYCFGRDGLVLEENCNLLGVAFPFEQDRFHNIRELFKQYGIPADDYMSSTIVKAFGQKPSRPGHSALNDARTILDGLRLLRQRIKTPNHNDKLT